MVCRSRKIRLMSFVLAVFAFMFFCFGPLGQSARAVAGVDDAVIAIIIAALAACGISLIAYNTYDSLEQFVATLFNEFCEDQGTTPAYELQGLRYGRNILGQILINNRFVQLIQTFGAWLKLKFNLSDNSTVIANRTAWHLGTAEMYQSGSVFTMTYNGNTAYNQWNFIADDGSHWFLIFQVANVNLTGQTIPNADGLGTNIGVFFVSPDASATTNVSWNRYVNGVKSEELTKTPTGNFGGTWYLAPSGYSYLIDSGTTIDAFVFPGTFTFTGSSTRRLLLSQLNYLAENYDLYFDPNGIEIKTGTVVLPEDNSDYDFGDGAVIDVGAGWSDSISDVLDGTIPGDWADGKEGISDITYEGEQDITEQVEEAGEAFVSPNASDYQTPGLESVFPFCIPFDLYNFVSALDATPEAPVVNWRFYVPGIVDETVVIDLSVFDAAASLLRKMELLLFCVGLAFVTRKIIRG